jgi:hypothetical protein
MSAQDTNAPPLVDRSGGTNGVVCIGAIDVASKSLCAAKNGSKRVSDYTRKDSRVVPELSGPRLNHRLSTGVNHTDRVTLAVCAKPFLTATMEEEGTTEVLDPSITSEIARLTDHFGTKITLSGIKVSFS